MSGWVEKDACGGEDGVACKGMQTTGRAIHTCPTSLAYFGLGEFGYFLHPLSYTRGKIYYSIGGRIEKSAQTDGAISRSEN